MPGCHNSTPGCHNSATYSHNAPATWHTVGGLRLDTQPSQSGFYIKNGEKVIIR